MRMLLALPLLLLFSCKSVSSSQLAGSAVPPPSILSLERIDDDEQFLAFGKDSSGLAQGGKSVKLLLDLRNQPKAFFINGNSTHKCGTYRDLGTRRQVPLECNKYHWDFAKEALKISEMADEFNDVTYFTQDKRYAAVTMGRYALGERGIAYTIQLYPQDLASSQNIVTIAQTIRDAAPATEGKLYFLPTGNQQNHSDVKEKLAELGVGLLTLDDLLGQSQYIFMNEGHAYGYLRLFPQNQDELNETDIPVFDELPLDLTVVAGVITKAFQDTNSHINLKSKERETPNMVLRNATRESPELSRWIDQPIHLHVTKTGFTIEASSAEEIAKVLESKRPEKWKSPEGVVSQENIIRNYENMCPSNPGRCLGLGLTFGAKAANLGFLKEVFKDKTVKNSTTLSYDPIPKGFGISIQYYRDFIKANPILEGKIKALVDAEKAENSTLSSADRTRLSAEIRELALNGILPAGFVEAVQKQMASTDPSVVKWKIRSSATTEDIPKFDGAGLHDSYTSNLTKKDKSDHSCRLEMETDTDPGELPKLEVKPKTVACAIKGVYASLWNKRAIEERNFARYDHGTAYMGLSVLPTYATESPIVANSVVVTRVINSPDIFGYSLSIQKDNNTVTNPLPGSWSEVTVVALPTGDGSKPSFSTTRFAKPHAGVPTLTSNVLTEAENLEMVRLTMKIEEAYCRYKAGYYAQPRQCQNVSWDKDNKNSALDLEIKRLQNGQWVIKQVREFGGR